MPVLTLDKSELTVIDKEAGAITDCTAGRTIQSEERDRLLLRISSLPKSRRRRIITVWQQLAEGRYECDEKIDIICDKLHAEVIR
jgi:hypothetical protein